MFRRKSLKQHEAELDYRFSRNTDQVFEKRLKYRCDIALAELRRRRRESPECWALTARTFSLAARYIIRSSNPEEMGQRLGISANAAIRCMAACVKLSKDRCVEYRQRGIDPQVNVVIQPCFEYAKQTYAEWKAWNLTGASHGE